MSSRRAMSSRRFLNLVTDSNRRKTYALRLIDASGLFEPAKPLDGGHEPAAAAIEDVSLPDPTFTLEDINRKGVHGKMDFFLLKRWNNHMVVATDNGTGRTLLCDFHRRSVRALPIRQSFKCNPISVSTGNRLYVFDRVPIRDFKPFESLSRHYGDWSWHFLEDPPFVHSPSTDHERYSTSSSIDSYTAVYDGKGPSIWISTAGQGAYSYATTPWPGHWASKRGDWALPFSGLAKYVHEYRLWFGLSRPDDAGDSFFCAIDITTATQETPPVMQGLWKDTAAPPMEGEPMGPSYSVYLGLSRFCVARFHRVVTGEERGTDEIFAVLTGVEVERRGEELVAVRRRSQRYRLALDPNSDSLLSSPTLAIL